MLKQLTQKVNLYCDSIITVIIHSLFYRDPVYNSCLLYTSPSPRDRTRSRMPSSA